MRKRSDGQTGPCADAFSTGLGERGQGVVPTPVVSEYTHCPPPPPFARMQSSHVPSSVTAGRTGVRSTCAATSPRFTRLNKPAATSLGPIGGVACGSRRALRSMAPFVLAVFS